jgi:hypothetical protein
MDTHVVGDGSSYPCRWYSDFGTGLSWTVDPYESPGRLLCVAMRLELTWSAIVMMDNEG